MTDCYKVAYDSKTKAERAIKTQLREIRTGRRHRVSPQKSYLCGCGKWHITSSVR